MSALPDTVVPFSLPKSKPRVVQKEAPPDQRKVAVLPIRALTDSRLTDGAVRILGLLCSYCNRAGITWVSQKRLAEDMQTSRQNITNQLAKLRDAGYVEIVRKGFRGERCNTLRVIFDPSIKAEDAISITSSIEDTRPPAIREEQQLEASQQIDREGQARIAKLISQAIKQPPTRSATMPKSGETVTVRKMREAIKKAQTKESKPAQKQQPIGNRTVSNEGIPKVSNEGLNQASIGHSPVSSEDTDQFPITRHEHIRESLKKDSLNRFNTVLGNFEVERLTAAGMTAEQIDDSLDTLLPIYQAEGLTPTSQLLADSILQMHRDTA